MPVKSPHISISRMVLMQITRPANFLPLSHPKTIANGEAESGVREPLSRTATGLWRMRRAWNTKGRGTGGRPAGELRTYQMRREGRLLFFLRPLGNRGGMGALAF